jgi:hypothetical protein
MLVATHTPANEATKEPVPVRQPSCPSCGGQLVELRGQSRCTRCSFMWCAGCETSETFTCSGGAAD